RHREGLSFSLDNSGFVPDGTRDSLPGSLIDGILCRKLNKGILPENYLYCALCAYCGEEN
ncbi:MAG: hypothetical protein NTU44_11845, partial [Bacteroidetes bacterium]|nr:hypothetical protein [Bacteroidota bacterium]